MPGALLEDMFLSPDFFSVTVTRTVYARDSESGKDFDLMVMTGRSRSYIDL